VLRSGQTAWCTQALVKVSAAAGILNQRELGIGTCEAGTLTAFFEAQAQGSIGPGVTARWHRATDSTAEQRPEVARKHRHSRAVHSREEGAEETGTTRGKRPMVTSERLLARGTLRRVKHDRGSTTSDCHPSRTCVGQIRLVRGAKGSGPGVRKRHEPHDRLQGETNLQGVLRSKPSKPGGTAGTEGVRGVAAADRRRASRMRGARRDRTQSTCIDGGAIFETPGEEVERSTRRTGRETDRLRAESGTAQKECAPTGAGSLKVGRTTRAVPAGPWSRGQRPRRDRRSQPSGGASDARGRPQGMPQRQPLDEQHHERPAEGPQHSGRRANL